MRLPCLLLFTLAFATGLHAELKLPAIIGDNMVLQQKQVDPIWGWDTPGTEVTVSFAGQTQTAKAGADGKWTVKLNAMNANATPQTMVIQGSSKRELKNILIGEVWLCSGQSNMGFDVSRTRDADVEALGSKHPNICLITVPPVGTQEPQTNFNGQWEACNPETVQRFTAVGYFYGRLLHQALDVPVGLIDNAWGGSACEAWVRRDVLEKDKRFESMITQWKQTEANHKPEAFEKQKADHLVKMAEWNKARMAAAKAKTYFTTVAPRPPQNPMTGQHRPGNLYAGCLYPLIGYGIKGVIWYQGESNALRAHEYGYLFPLMIQHWRDEWKQGDFPFYWVQLADFRDEPVQPSESSWAELREAQTQTMSKLPQTGQAVIIDVGEGKDIHPTNKRDVAERLVRWPLAKDYGVQIAYRSPEFKEARFEGNKAIVTLETFGSTLQTFDVAEVRGVAVCGEDRKWAWADAQLVGGNQIQATSKAVPQPVAVRYAWSENPVCNLYSKEGLPVTPFRSDDFPMITDPANPNGQAAKAAQAAAERAAQAKQRQEKRGAQPAPASR